MVKWADVLVESSKGGTWEKWGLTDEVLWEANPALVILHISGFGNWGDPDYVRKASFDPIGQAFSGYSNLNGFPDSPAQRDEALHRRLHDRSHGCLGHACRCHPRARDGRRRVHRLLPVRGARAPAGRHAVRRHQPRHTAHAHRQRRPRGRVRRRAEVQGRLLPGSRGRRRPGEELVEFFGFADDPDFQPLGYLPLHHAQARLQEPGRAAARPRCEVPRRAGQLVREAHG